MTGWDFGSKWTTSFVTSTRGNRKHRHPCYGSRRKGVNDFFCHTGDCIRVEIISIHSGAGRWKMKTSKVQSQETEMDSSYHQWQSGAEVIIENLLGY
mmetsp:Transcript_43415/g.104911  ORF Transcript_43415/g.104911 Transcript_43415/m.104911 type:complete len:97 (-) Transcript_43415:58-348(-)